jgi:hypothetical protein
VTEGDENKLLKLLQTPEAIVTYRAVVGVFAALTLTLIGIIGTGILTGISELKASMVIVQVSVARQTGRIDTQESRIGRVEFTVDGLAKEQGSLDHRVTVIEAQRGPKIAYGRGA